MQHHKQLWQFPFENSAIGMFLANFGGRFFAANKTLRNMLGYQESDLYRLTLSDVTYKEDRRAFLGLIREVVEGERRHFQIETRCCCNDGALLRARINVSLVPRTGDASPSLLGVVEENSQSKLAEDELQLQIDVLQNVPAMAFTVMPDGRCDFANRFFLEVTGMPREYVEAHPNEWNMSGNSVPPLLSALHPQDRERAAGLFWNGIRSGEGWAFETQYFHASEKKYRWYLDRAVPLRDAEGRIRKFVGTCADIEPLKRAQDSLRESEMRLKAFFENSPNLIFMKDRHGRYLYFNREFARVLRIDQQQSLGKKDEELFPPEQAAMFRANDSRVLEVGHPLVFEEDALQEDGKHTSIVHKFPLFDAEGKIHATGGIVTDITDRKRAEQELLNLKEELTAELAAMSGLHELRTRSLLPGEFQEHLEEVLGATITMLKADFGNIQLYNSENRTLDIVVARGFKQDFLEHFRSLRDISTACGPAMELRERIIIEDVESDPQFAPHRHIAASAGFRAVQSTPLFSRNGEFLGVLSTHFRRPHRPSQRELRFTDLYARHAAEILERRRLELARRQVEEQYRNVVEAVNDSVVTVDDSGRILLVNPATTRIFGYSAEELIGQPLTILMPERMREQHRSGFCRYLRTGERHLDWQGMEFIAVAKNGKEFPVSVSFAEVAKNGQTLFTGFIRDITDRQQAEEMRVAQVRQAAVRAEVSAQFGEREDLKTILRRCVETIAGHLGAAFACIWILDGARTLLELRASQGIPPDSTLAYDRIPLSGRLIGRIARERKPVLVNDVPKGSSNHEDEREGSERLFRFAGCPLLEGDRATGVLAMFSTVPISAGAFEILRSAAEIVAHGIDRKLAEERLRTSERSLRELTETIPEMLWSADPTGAHDYCNRRVVDYTGLSAQQVRGDGWKAPIHPDDVERASRAWTAAVSSGESFQCEFRWRRASDLAYRWCISNALPLRDNGGRIIRWFGTVVDLHDWRESQQALQMAQAEMARVSRLTTVGELAASIAHEVNQPLAAITNNSSACLRLLTDRSLKPEVLREALERIVVDGARASAVIARVRAFILKAPAEKSQLHVNDLIQEVLALIDRELQENHVLLDVQLAEALPAVLGDRVQLQQVLLNLITNGIESMEEVTNRPRLLQVQSRVDASGVVVAVRDSGTGLRFEVDRIFTPFFTTKAKGMGMGLCISRSLVEGHGGHLWAVPNSPHGAVFSFTLPPCAGSPV